MANQRAAQRYATALFSLAKERGSIDSIGQELDGIVSLFDANAEVQEFFEAPVIDRTEKASAILEAFEHRVNELTLHTLLLLVQKRREALLKEVVSAYHGLALAEQALAPLTLTSARPLQPDELQAMVARLTDLYGKEFSVTEAVDPELIGGIRVLMGDRRLDGSIAGRLEKIAATLFSQS